MKKVLIAYAGRMGHTEKLTQYNAEGVRMGGHEVDLKKISDIDDIQSAADYGGYVFGCPAYHRDMTGGMKTFLFKAENLNLLGKIGGAFGSYAHSGAAPRYVFDAMQYVFKMDMTDWAP